MRAKLDRLGPWLTTGVLAALCLAPSGCKKAGSSSAPEADQSYAGAEAEAEPDPLAELAALEDDMRALGLPTAARDRAGQPKDATTDAPAAGEDEAVDTVAEEAPAPTGAHVAPPSTGPARDDESQHRCVDVCSLSDSICTLEERICSLAESHGDDQIYVDACMRASEDCDVAGDACTDCRGG